jgi:hypothetical protein
MLHPSLRVGQDQTWLLVPVKDEDVPYISEVEVTVEVASAYGESVSRKRVTVPVEHDTERVLGNKDLKAMRMARIKHKPTVEHDS